MSRLFFDWKVLEEIPDGGVLLILLVPFLLGLVTAVLCLMRSRPAKTAMGAASAGAMLVLPMLIKSHLVDSLSGDTSRVFGSGAFGGFLGNLFSTAYDKEVACGAGYYLFVGCFALCFLFCLLGVRRVHEPQVRVKCLACGALNPEDARICNQCGALLAAQPGGLGGAAAAAPPSEKGAQAPAPVPEVEVRPVAPAGYWPGCPAVLQEVRLLIGQTGVSLSLAVFNQWDKPIRSVYFTATAFDDTGSQVGAPVPGALLDLQLPPGTAAPLSKPLPLPGATVRRVALAVDKLAFTDDTVWAGGGAPAVEPPAQEKLTEAQRQALALAKLPPFLYFPRQQEGYWQCGCGGLNPDLCESCLYCHADRATALENASPGGIEKLVAWAEGERERLAREEKERAQQRAREGEERARRERQQRLETRATRKKSFIKALPALLAAVVAVAGVAAALGALKRANIKQNYQIMFENQQTLARAARASLLSGQEEEWPELRKLLWDGTSHPSVFWYEPGTPIDATEMYGYAANSFYFVASQSPDADYERLGGVFGTLSQFCECIDAVHFIVDHPEIQGEDDPAFETERRYLAYWNNPDKVTRVLDGSIAEMESTDSAAYQEALSLGCVPAMDQLKAMAADAKALL